MNLLTEFASFTKKHHNFEARSIDQVSEWISRHHAEVKLTPLSDNKVDPLVRFSRASVGDVALVSYDYRSALKGELSEGYNAYFICVPVSGACTWLCPQNGRIQHTPSQLLIYRRDAGLQYSNSADYKVLSLVVPAKLLENQVQSMMGTKLDTPLSFAPLVDLDSAAGRVIASMVDYLMSQFNHLPDPFGSPFAAHNMTRYLSTVLLSRLPHNYSAVLNSQNTTAVPRSVKRAEEYMHKLCTQTITIEQLAEAAGCSPRALHSAFRKFRGHTPMAALSDIRLMAAHSEIINETGTVLEVATKYGFSNAGRFAKLYARKFGQKPSQTRLLGARAYPMSTSKIPSSSLTG